YTYILLFAYFLASGCSSYSDGQDRNAELNTYKKQLDSLNRLKMEKQRTLDSLENASRIKEEQLMQLKIEQDSLNKILKEENK
ncbi:MAG: hypothetical protein L0Y76_10700, partial [Ignavibacteria bacterium]|nr:hypothetical protein [Ignavibacteria bacterium]